MVITGNSVQSIYIKPSEKVVAIIGIENKKLNFEIDMGAKLLLMYGCIIL